MPPEDLTADEKRLFQFAVQLYVLHGFERFNDGLLRYPNPKPFGGLRKKGLLELKDARRNFILTKTGRQLAVGEALILLTKEQKE